MPPSPFMKGLRAKVGNDLLQIPTISVLIFDKQRRVLLARHVEGGLWTTPGGMVEPFETPTDAAIREAWEETGLEVKLQRIVGVFGGASCTTTYANGDRVSWVSTVFEATVLGGELRPDNVETLDTRYFSRRDLQNVDCTAHVHEFLEVAWSAMADTYFQPPSWFVPREV